MRSSCANVPAIYPTSFPTDSMKRIHIVGASPRTGTTLMAEAMVACFDIDHHTEHEDRLFTRAKGDGNIYLTKCPKDILIVGPSLLVDPNLYVIYMIRDPRDIICSKHRRAPDRYWASLRYWNTYTKYARQLSGHPRFIEVRYEDFVSDPDVVQDELMRRMPFLTMRAPFSRYHEVATPSKDSRDALGGKRPIKPVSVGKWKDHLERVAGQLHLHGSITDDLIEFGYERDDTWREILKGVTPDTSASHWPEYMTEDEEHRRLRGRYKEAFIRTLERLGVQRRWLRRMKAEAVRLSRTGSQAQP